MDSHPSIFSDYSSNDNSVVSSFSSFSPIDPQLLSLDLLSQNLESIFSNSSDSFSDARIVVTDAQQLHVHRCILSARSPFFKNLFSETSSGGVFQARDLVKGFDVGVESLRVVLGYLYSGKVTAMERGCCVCVDDHDCSHIGCRPALDSILELLYTSFVFKIPQLVALYQRHLLDILDMVTTDDTLVILSVAKICGKICERLLTKCIEAVVQSDIDIVTLEKSLSWDVVKQIMDLRQELGLIGFGSNSVPDKHVKRIHRALESDDVELVRMLLKEGHTTLDDAHALHYAVAYCDAKTATELLEFGLADVNLRNPRGYCVLHVAAIRKEPKIIVSLLTKGARPSSLTLDGRKALQISKRLTRYVDYHRSTEEGKASPKDRLCIEVLEQAEGRDPLLREVSVPHAMAGDDPYLKLLYLENRVSVAKLLFPMESKVAMDIAQVDGTHEFPLVQNSTISPTGKRTVNSTELPYKIEEEHLSRMRALSKTVELGKQFFPRCSNVLNKIMDDGDLQELAHLGVENPEECQLKKQRYMELQGMLSQAFIEDKEEFDRSTAMSSSSSSSTCMGVATKSKKFTSKK